ncbi:MAG: DUF4446 family protein [Chloroflexi bacterium]|nr:MAG: DUF4446 family protein [Chloroflexota bacterium]
MPDLNQWLLDNLWIVVGILLVVVVGLALGVIALNRRLARATLAYRSLADEASGRPLGEVIVAHGERVRTLENRLAEVDGRYRQLADRSRGSLQHIGLVRFNPFDDTGSDQSFAIALLDDEANGIVVSSLHGRAGTRIFAKPIRAGEATHTLSDEEQEALKIASQRDR